MRPKRSSVEKAKYFEGGDFITDSSDDEFLMLQEDASFNVKWNLRRKEKDVGKESENKDEGEELGEKMSKINGPETSVKRKRGKTNVKYSKVKELAENSGIVKGRRMLKAKRSKQNENKLESKSDISVPKTNENEPMVNGHASDSEQNSSLKEDYGMDKAEKKKEVSKTTPLKEKKKYECPFCKKVFTYRAIFNKHLRIHSTSPKSNQTKETPKNKENLPKIKLTDNDLSDSEDEIHESPPSFEPAINPTTSEKSVISTDKIFMNEERMNLISKQREVFNQTEEASDINNERTNLKELETLDEIPRKKKRGRPRKIDDGERLNKNPPKKRKLLKDKVSELKASSLESIAESSENSNDSFIKTTLGTDSADNQKDSESSGEPSSQESTNTEDETSSVTDFKGRSSSSFLEVTSKEVDGTKTKVYRCRICNKNSLSRADLIKHIRTHTGERPFKCKQCGKSFRQITALRGHETIHSGSKPFACDVCGKTFAIKDRLRLHMRIHTGEKPHQCSQCDLSFARLSQVSQHARIHEAVKSTFKCEECGLTFASYHTLKSHVNAHLGIKEYQCGACGKKFHREEGMYKHIRTVHRGSRPYTCNICGKAFKGHLQQHMRLHRGDRPYKCTLCDASFTQNSQLTVHLRIHSGERPYKCQICGASFAHSSACKIHMRSHTGEKPFKCIVCNHAFAQLPHLKKHMKCVHNADKPYMCAICKEYFQTQADIDGHKRRVHGMYRSPEEEAQRIVEEASLARLRNRLSVLLYRISSEDRRTKFGFGNRLIDEVLKLSLASSGHVPQVDSSLTPLEELRQNVLLLLRWTIPRDTMDEYHRNNMTVDEVLDMLTA